MKSKSLQARLFRAYLLQSCILLILSALLSYYFLSRQLIKSQLEASSSLNGSFYTQVENGIKNLDSVSVNINYSNLSKNILNSSYELQITDQMLTGMADFFISMSGTELRADQINLYDFSGHVLKSGISTMVTDIDSSEIPWLEKACAFHGSKILSQPYQTTMYSGTVKNLTWYLSLYRSFNNQYRRPVGAIETVKRCSSIFKSIISYQKKHKSDDSAIYIFDESGSLIFPYDITEDEKEQICLYYPLLDTDSKQQKLTSPLTQKKEYAAISHSAYTGYTYVCIQPEASILMPVYRMLKIILLFFFFLLLLSAFLSYRLSRTLARPIKHLKHVIQRMELDTLGKESLASYPVCVDELDELYQSFQIMRNHLQTSMQQLIESQNQEVKSRAMALQTQLNPHFYYNSLSSIIVLAENGQTDTVIRMCRNLSKIMRYITDCTNTAVQLKDEIDYVEKYLYCMKVRYQSSLSYTLIIDESMYELPVIKLFIQPLVENAIKYGSDCEPPWHITIEGKCTESEWYVQVTDSGNGFSAEAIEALNTQIAAAGSSCVMPPAKMHGMGLYNLYLRWHLQCKEYIIFKYENTLDGHGRVTIGRRTR